MQGTVNIDGTNGETATQGLDDLGKRCAEYYKLGARFAKWYVSSAALSGQRRLRDSARRAVLKIGAKEPTEAAILENAHGLARYAAICQENGLVPIIEPEVLPDGPHTIEECARATQRVRRPLLLACLIQTLVSLTVRGPCQTIAAVVKYCHDFNILWEGSLLKPNMVLPGTESGKTATPDEVAHYTVAVLTRTVPPALPGIMARLRRRSLSDRC